MPETVELVFQDFEQREKGPRVLLRVRRGEDFMVEAGTKILQALKKPNETPSYFSSVSMQ
jgi:hypothetical protein